MTYGHAGKHDGDARSLWGAAYQKIPKSVFAVAAYYLAQRAQPEHVPGGAETQFLLELKALAGVELITKQQFTAAAREVRACIVRECEAAKRLKESEAGK